ncbi:hypothetical protein HELRODRAFT_189192 [Helobdella robusta]|uniref:Uncharacterized protein n=1 Tax=Helobdella robusta TaxID=6412 RepID=T1FQR7_HELRO|nr:hypothetical protein HELRODRAFT_189192 [Helobdella robusta]ESN96316.1 hypothetical protein HELRODRAFT_189192 [Helobdella robusta]
MALKILMVLALSSCCIIDINASVVNVSIRKPAYMTNEATGHSAKLGVDNDITTSTETLSSQTTPKWFVVDLVNAYQVKYIILYNEHSCGSCDSDMNYFNVGLTNSFNPSGTAEIRGTYDQCGWWPAPVTAADTQMSVICEDGTKFSRFIIIQQSLEVENNGASSSLQLGELMVYANDVFPQYENVAYKKKAYLSTEQVSASNCVDGNTTSFCSLGSEVYGPYMNMSHEYDWFIVDLARPYQIVYVTLHAKATDTLMNNFVVGQLSSVNPTYPTYLRGRYSVCGYGPPSYTIDAQPMRVDCNDRTSYFRYVIVQQEASQAYDGENNADKYVGCFRNFQIKLTYQESSLDTCIYICRQMNVPYASVKDSQCFCAPLNVGYLGCFIDGSLDLSADYESIPSRTIETCITYCLSRNYDYAGLQRGDTCKCGNSYGAYGKDSDSACNTNCAGNTNEECGDSLKHYLVCSKLSTSKHCTGVYHCSTGNNFTPDMTCQSHSCQPGWTGGACDKRDCQTNNGGCGIHPCSSFQIGTTTYTECVCRLGYTKSFYNDDCVLGEFFQMYVQFVLTCNTTNSICVAGSTDYSCNCKSGYQHPADNNTFCYDIDKCAASTNPCRTPSETCVNTDGSKKCPCSPGYMLSAASVCEDIDECFENKNNCTKPLSTCLNTYGSFICICPSGYVQVNNDCSDNVLYFTSSKIFFKRLSKNKFFLDIDECLYNPNACDNETTTCVNRVGTYSCKCLSGFYAKNPWTCEDIDECARNKHNCTNSTETCVNTFGSFVCQYINECKVETSSACNIATSTCFNMIDTYNCTCLDGFFNKDQWTCEDIDECALNQHNCSSPTETCINTAGSFACQCSSGFQRFNNICSDINECLDKTSPCDPQTSTCVNQIGSYNCSCFSGFQNKGQWICEDINECVKNANACNTAISTCVNNVGTFSCACFSGYVNKDQWNCEVSGERNVLFAFIGVFAAVVLTLMGVFAYWAASYQFKPARANFSE